jgi:hypothetical protein
LNPQEQQVIDSLFQRLAQGAVQAGPRDPQAEALIQQHFSQLPGAAYYMAQTMLVQERALQQAEARLAQQQPGGGGSFLPPAGGYAPGAPAPGYYPGAQPVYQQQPQQSFGGGGFLAGAGKIALGVGGGLLVAEAASGIARDLFGGGGFDRDDRGGFDQDDRGDYQQDQQQDDGGFDQGDNDQSGGFDDGGGDS